MKAAIAAAAAGLLAACAHAPATTAPVERAAAWLQGRFDNAAQARSDPQFAAVTVRWTPLWPERDDGRWFLVEQSLSATPGTPPYRVRVHRLRDDGEGGVASDVFLPPRAEDIADADADADAARGSDGLDARTGIDARTGVDAGTGSAAPAVFTFAQLEPLPGCTVRLRPLGGRFRGATRGRDCPSHFRGASYTTAEVVLDADGFASWDRGFAADGTQVWGARTGPYVFRRRPD